MENALTTSELQKKLEYYCAYQERCHQEVVQKLWSLGVPGSQQDELLVHLITHNFLNEERFAHTFTLSKFHQKNWGKVRIKNELKQRQLTERLIRQALDTIPEEAYETTFERLAEKTWEAITGTNTLQKQKKFCDSLLRKGWESDRVYAKMKQLK